jgi:hypothetical protein
MTLQDQIRARWGQYGDWNSAGLDQVDALSRLLQANGVNDLSQFNLKARDYVLPATQERMGGDAEYIEDIPERKGTAFDAFYGDKQLGFLGDINRDGSYSAQPTGQVAGNEPLGMLRGGGDLLGWSAQGGGNTSFQVMQGPNGEPVVVPVWGSSSQSTYEGIRGVASIAALAAGGTFAGAGGTTGAAAQGALQGYGTAVGGNILANPNGDVDSLVKSSLTGAATGAISGGVKGYGAEQGWSPNVTKAVSNAATTAARGGDLRDVAGGAVSGGLLNFTGDPALDRAIAAGGSTLIRGGSGSDALRSGVLSGATGLLSPGSSTKSFGDVSGDALSEDNIVRFDGGTTVGDDFDWDAWLQEQMDGSNRGTDPYQFNWEDLGIDPGTDYSNEGRNYPTVDSTQGPGGSPVNTSGSPNFNDYLKTALQKVFQGTGDGKGGDGALWPLLLGGALGANSSRDQNQTIQRAPWEAAQPYIKGLMADGAQLYNQYKAQPFNDAQKAGYNNMAGLLDLVNKNAGGLLSGFQANASGANQFRRGAPQQGLIGSSFNPTAQEWNPQSYGRFGG